MLKLPRIISRTMRSLTESDRFHAYEWKYLLLFCIYPIFEGILGRKYLDHFLKLSEAMHILCSCEISAEKLDRADELLKSYVIEFEEIFGKENMVFNVHLLLHTTECVRTNGPLFAYSNYSTEDNLGHLVSFVKGKTDALSQIVNRYWLEKNLFSHIQKSIDAKNYYEFIQYQHFKNITKTKKFLLVGKSRCAIYDTDAMKQLQDLNFELNNETQIYRAVFLNFKIYFESIKCSEPKLTNDSFVCIPEENIFGEILYVVLKNEEVFFLINNKYEIKENGCRISKCLIELRERTGNHYAIVNSTSVKSKFALCETSSSIVCSEFPNLFERN